MKKIILKYITNMLLKSNPGLFFLPDLEAGTKEQNILYLGFQE